MRTITRISAFGAALLACRVWAGTATITIDIGKPGPRLNPRMYAAEHDNLRPAERR